MRHFRSVIFLTAAVLALGLAVAAQENDVKVVDEVVAQVNDGVITLSGIKREMKGIVDSKVQEGMKREDAQKYVDEKQGELIANLINEELLLQKAKELGLEKDIEAALNARFLQIMKQQNFKTLDSLYEAMRKEGVDPDDIREIWRRQATKDEVIRREVQAKVYWEPPGSKVKEYYEANKAKFTRPETVTLSEIFLNFAGQNQEAVRARAKALLAQLRGGADFEKLVMENSEAPDVAKTKGSVGTYAVPEFEKGFAPFAKAIQGVKAGGYAEPVEDDIGIHIIKVDKRQAASTEAEFDEEAVRRAMLEIAYPDAFKKYMTKLREDSFIKISESYRPIVSPLLFADERSQVQTKSEKPEQTTANKNQSKSKSPKRK